MLWATLATILIMSLSGGAGISWINTMADLAPDVIEDDERLDRANLASDGMKGVVAEFEERIRTHRAEIVALDADYYATPLCQGSCRLRGGSFWGPHGGRELRAILNTPSVSISGA